MTQPVTSEATNSGTGEIGSHFEASQDVHFPFLYGTDTGPEQTVSQDAHDQNHGNDVGNGASPLGLHHLREDEKEEKRKEVIEENDPFVAKG